MRKMFASVPLACLVVVGAVLGSTAAQDRTAQPGQPTLARVWIQNRGVEEAVPVNVQELAREAPPLRVEVVGTSSATGTSATARTRWEYRSVSLHSGQDATPVLNTAGADGWEMTNLVVHGQAETIVVLKRPR